MTQRSRQTVKHSGVIVSNSDSQFCFHISPFGV
jgi:hypothetical protein